jgi:hypothetical protein
VASLQKLFQHFDRFGAAYKAAAYDVTLVPPIVAECYTLLNAAARPEPYNSITRKLSSGKTVEKKYSVFADRKSDELSRPFRPLLFIAEVDRWFDEWNEMLGTIDRGSRTMSYERTDIVLYSACTAFFAVIDLFMRSARKRNGTFFEWLLGTLLHETTGFPMRAHIAILSTVEAGEAIKGEEGGSVPTDIVLDQGEGRYKLVFPSKISTRERINQIFTHQRILDIEFPGQYRSALLGVSECQLLKGKGTVQETCVPTQVSFNEKYVAHIDALYYLDPPFAYIDDAITVPVRRISDLFALDLAAMTLEAEREAIELCNAVVSTVRCNRPKHTVGEHRFDPPRGSLIASASLSPGDVAD